MKLHKTKSGIRKNIWHITGTVSVSPLRGGGEVIHTHSLCNSGTYSTYDYQRGETLGEGPKCFFDGTQDLCPACVAQAYKANMIKVIEVS